MIETTGLADPAPVAQTFFVDEEMKAMLRLDAIVTVADAKHLIAHLDDVKPDGVGNEAVEQIAFADRIVLNKVDLVDGDALAEVEGRIRAARDRGGGRRRQSARLPAPTTSPPWPGRPRAPCWPPVQATARSPCGDRPRRWGASFG